MKKIRKFLNSFQLRKLLGNKRFTIPLSIGLSVVLWIVIVTNANPTRARTIPDLTVNVNLENTFALENGMSIIGDFSKQKFTVSVSGASYAVSSLKKGDINLYASAASVDAPGEYNLTVTATKNNAMADYEIVSISPATIKITFDYIDTKEFTIKPKAEGVSVKEGLIAENGIVSGTEKDTITISGPRTVMSKIDSVVALTKVNKTLSASETFDAKVMLYDADGNEIEKDNLTLSEENVKVTVPISQTKTVPVLVDFSNLPDDFDKNSISYKINYSEVTVIGKPEMVEKINDIKLTAIDISTVNPDNRKFEVSAKLPEGVRLVDNIDVFTVEFNINNYIQKTLNVSEIKYTGLAGGLTVDGTLEIKNVKICGPRNIINKIKSDSVYAEINLTDKTVGQHSVEASIKFKLNNNVWAIGTYTTNVTIK